MPEKSAILKKTDAQCFQLSRIVIHFSSYQGDVSMSTQPFQVRYNPMQLTTFSAFANVNGAFRQQIKDVYFIRMIGCQNQSAFLQELKQLDQLLQQRGCALRLLQFPDLPQSERIAYYSQNWNNPSKQLQYRADDARLQQTIQQCLQQLPDFYQQYHPTASSSMLRNFMVKILFWADTLFPTLFLNWNINRSPKFVCSGTLKKQEYFFLYFLTQLGIDVLYFNPAGDLMLDTALLALSAKFDCQQYADFSLPAMTTKPYAVPVNENESKQIMPPSPAAMNMNLSPLAEQPAKRQQTTAQPNKLDPQESRYEKSFEELATLASSVVMLEVLDQQGQCFKTGSGILINPQGYILTNFHVVSDGHHYRVKLEGDSNSYISQEIIKYNYIHDLALLRIDRSSVPLPIYNGNNPLIRGQKVVAIGSPLGLFNSVSDGIISGFRTIQDTDMIQFTAPTSPGSSGGALLNMQGEVIGICTAGINEGQNINLAVDYRAIRFFIEGFLQ